MGNADKKPLISVIVPVYKVEQYLNACVDSILAQTYTNLEIILVDDGSPDQCGAICDEYAAKDSRVKVIHKVNGGLSDARNAGMEVSTGDYLAFVDSDDLLAPDALDVLYGLAEAHHADLVIGGHVRFSDETVLSFSPAQTPEQVMTPSEAMIEFFKNGCASWARLYKRAVHIHTFFPVGEINEDEAIVLSLLDHCETVVKTDQVIYGYRNRPESITTSTFSLKKLDWYRHCKANYEWIRANYPELEEAAAIRYRNSLLWTLTEIALAEGDYRSEVKKLVGELKTNRKLFKKILYQHSTDKIRADLLTYLPFAVYRAFIRIKRNH